ncbi:hypothetical protein MAE02_68880 [Microvirga aerophila]|uniref:Uncharacterized protein n=2 Tax=Microvirga aerophila TaxID=670291 RepID=A0A512C4P2_9HYPH|nr:hypothetical protein MAE02_68880 [Microvirga aerophila]
MDCIMFKTLVGSVIAATLVSTSALATEFPKKFQGVWTGSAETCDLYKRGRSLKASDHQWVKIAAKEVTGTTQGRIIGPSRPGAIEITDSSQDISVEFSLDRNGSLLYETLSGARAGLTYFRCQ